MTFLPVIIISLVVVFVAALGGVFVSHGLNSWYPELIMPSWAPPDSVFAPVWTVLYTLIAISASRAWYKLKASPLRAEIMGLFALNGIGNLLWPYLFFSVGLLEVAFADIILLEATILMLIALLWRAERWAALCLIPYAAWVAFAGALNYSIVVFNPF